MAQLHEQVDQLAPPNTTNSLGEVIDIDGLSHGNSNNESDLHMSLESLRILKTNLKQSFSPIWKKKKTDFAP